MARLNKQVLGRVSGAVGDIVFRERNGKNFIGLKPSRFVPGTDEASIARRARFALNAKLASTINNNDQLKSIWFNKAPSGLSSHNFILRQNYPLVQPGNISDMAKILPDKGFGLSSSNLTVISAQISVSVGPIGTNTGIDADAEPNTRLYCLLYLYDAVDESIESGNFMLFTSAIQATVLDSELTFNFALTNQETLLFSNYHMTKVLFALATLDNAGNIIRNSNTITGV